MTKLFSDVWVACDEVHKTFHHPWARCFTRMNSRCYDNSFFLLLKNNEIKGLTVEDKRFYLLNLLLWCWRRCDGEIINIVSRQRSTQEPQLAELWFDGMSLNVHKIILKVGIGVRITVSKVNSIVLVLKFNLKRQSVRRNISTIIIVIVVNKNLMIVSRAINVVIIISEVSDILSTSLPSDVVVGGIGSWIHEWSHSLFIQAIRLC